MFAKLNLNNIFSKSVLVSVLAMTGMTSCEKGAGSFSVLSDSSNFQQSVTFAPRKIDVLFVVDNSGSMSTSQNNLATNFPSFINKFISRGFDFKIAVTTTDAYYGDQFVNSGCSLCNQQQTRFRSGANPAVYVLDKNDYDFALASDVQKIKDLFTLNAKVGTTGSGDERAFSSFKAALNSPLNTGFHRPDAFLAVVIVSDEEDFSQDTINFNESYSNPALHTVSSYRDFLNTYTGGAASEDYSVSVISVIDEQCRSSLAQGSGAQKIAQRYMQLADLTGGSKNSICGSFDQSLDNISSQILTQAKPVYSLSRKPLVSTIQVIIDGVSVPQSLTQGWSYDSTANTITINGSTYKPNAGSSIVINFDPDLNAN